MHVVPVQFSVFIPSTAQALCLRNARELGGPALLGMLLLLEGPLSLCLIFVAGQRSAVLVASQLISHLVGWDCSWVAAVSYGLCCCLALLLLSQARQYGPNTALLQWFAHTRVRVGARWWIAVSSWHVSHSGCCFAAACYV